MDAHRLCDMALELDYELFFEDLQSHFGYSHNIRALLWDPRSQIIGLDCEYIISEAKEEQQDEDVKCSVEEIQRKRKKGNEK
ncbi:hypothetical protein N7471_003261 [Penicillium samsonianum]|uniref:uncharacterized protein n=1 Tax=Penicillium samsonianum TaxID=1882272 RepID=UPI0025496F7F|nr:uncharacterized protein N7471_003261 [Penicillium samsonianum]KAJ6143808.1 hypothetical protein N7471_003261 [Penicillium samsonianum]